MHDLSLSLSVAIVAILATAGVVWSMGLERDEKAERKLIAREVARRCIEAGEAALGISLAYWIAGRNWDED